MCCINPKWSLKDINTYISYHSFLRKISKEVFHKIPYIAVPDKHATNVFGGCPILNVKVMSRLKFKLVCGTKDEATGR